MVLTGVGRMADLQKKTSGIRNICILAHVDHGKRGVCDGQEPCEECLRSCWCEWRWGVLLTVLKAIAFHGHSLKLPESRLGVLYAHFFCPNPGFSFRTSGSITLVI